jgi:hypothetical protein
VQICTDSLEGRGPFALIGDARLDFFGNIQWRRLNTPVPQRAAYRRFIEIIMQDRIGEHPTGYDVGCSDNSANRQAALFSQFPLQAVKIKRTAAAGTEAEDTSAIASTIFNRGILAEHHTPGRWIGLDFIDPNEPVNKHWIAACPQPEEILCGKLERHDRLMQAEVDPSVVDFARCDFAQNDEVDRLIETYGQTDMANFAFSWSQGNAAECQAKFENALRCIKPGGVITLLEPARINRDLPPPHLEVLRDWSEIGGFVWDADGSEIYHAMSFSDGRCTQARILSDCAKLAGPQYQSVMNELISE